MKKLYDVGIKECSKCEYHLKCTECALPQQCQDMKAEIEKLDAENDCLVKELDKQCDECGEFNTSQARKKAIEEFAKELINRFSKNNLTQGFYVNISEIDLINLVKEMVGEAE